MASRDSLVKRIVDRGAEVQAAVRTLVIAPGTPSIGVAQIDAAEALVRAAIGDAADAARKIKQEDAREGD